MQLFLKPRVWPDDGSLESEPRNCLEGSQSVTKGKVRGDHGRRAGNSHSTSLSDCQKQEVGGGNQWMRIRSPAWRAESIIAEVV